VTFGGDIRANYKIATRKGNNVHIALFEIVVGTFTLAWLAALVWSLYVILTTPRPTWRSAGMSQMVWLIVVVFMPLIGTALFAIAGYRRLQHHATPSARATT
jgi:hypothetical protein